MRQPLSEEILKRPVDGVNIQPGLFEDQLSKGRTIVFFLRHFG